MFSSRNKKRCLRIILKSHLSGALLESHEKIFYIIIAKGVTVKTLNIGTPKPATVVVLNIKQFYFTMK